MQQTNTSRNDLRVSLIQSELVWHDPEANRRHFAATLAPLQGRTDLVVLPEVFTSGFSMEPERIAEPCTRTPDGLSAPTITWMQAQAARLNAALCGSVAMRIDEDGVRGCVNRLLFVTPDRQVQYYDKRHLFRMAGEHEHFLAGQQRLLVHFRGWDILPQVCYDLRFPVFSRNRNDYHLALYVANWPAPRRHPWRTLLQARAIENLSYVVGVNRVGSDSAGQSYSGDSMAVDFKGELLVDQAAGTTFTETATFSMIQLLAFREKFPAWQDADTFTIHPPSP
ncbi:MAG: amidohydrolase [Thiothrix sp.]|nr:amidohydrolase [Thiothrix sp.]HPE58797.1 amidohydrolase [Thiolinea sp.]